MPQDELGLSFAPTASAGERMRLGDRQGGLQQAVKLLSLRMPRVVGARAIAPQALLQSPGAMGGPPINAVIASVLRSVLGPEAAGLPSGPPPAVPPPTAPQRPLPEMPSPMAAQGPSPLGMAPTSWGGASAGVSPLLQAITTLLTQRRRRVMPAAEPMTPAPLFAPTPTGVARGPEPLPFTPPPEPRFTPRVIPIPQPVYQQPLGTAERGPSGAFTPSDPLLAAIVALGTGRRGW